MSIAATAVPPSAAASPSVIITMQNGQAVATVAAPVSSDLARPLLVDPRAARLLHPHPAAAGAAAERVLAAACSISVIDDAGGAQHVAWRGDDAVVASEIARVVDGHAARPVVAGRRRSRPRAWSPAGRVATSSAR